MPKLTYLLLVVVAATIMLTVIHDPKPIPTATASQKKPTTTRKSMNASLQLSTRTNRIYRTLRRLQNEKRSKSVITTAT